MAQVLGPAKEQHSPDGPNAQPTRNSGIRVLGFGFRVLLFRGLECSCLVLFFSLVRGRLGHKGVRRITKLEHGFTMVIEIPYTHTCRVWG